jgi:hypothetical protein
MSERKVDKVIKFSYEKDPDYRTFNVTHVWGVLDLVGNLTFDLIEERMAVPPFLELKIYNDGSSEEEWQAPSADFIRIKHAGINMPIEVVPQIIEWLQEKVDLFNSNKDK